MPNLEDFFGPVISSYTRQQAIEDGLLVDLTAIAPDVCAQHYKYPIACSTSAWTIIDKAVKNKRWMNDIKGVIHDMLWMSKAMAMRIPKSEQETLFEVIIRGAGRRSTYQFIIHCGPGDNAEPVLTITTPED